MRGVGEKATGVGDMCEGRGKEGRGKEGRGKEGRGRRGGRRGGCLITSSAQVV